MIQGYLADMATQLQAARLLLYHAAYMKDKGKRVTLEGSQAKLFASEVGFARLATGPCKFTAATLPRRFSGRALPA